MTVMQTELSIKNNQRIKLFSCNPLKNPTLLIVSILMIILAGLLLFLATPLLAILGQIFTAEGAS